MAATELSIARHRRVDQPGPGIDAAGEGSHRTDPSLLEQVRPRQAADAVVTIDDGQGTRRRLDFRDAAGQLAEGNERAVRQGGERVLFRLANVEQEYRLSRGELGGKLLNADLRNQN
jgi:hypothetical protein